MRISDWSSDVCSSDLIQPLGPPRLLVHEQRQALRRAVGQPLVDREAVALGLGDLLSGLVEEQLVVEAFRRPAAEDARDRSEEHTSELQSLMRISYAVFCLKKKKQDKHNKTT